VVDWNPPADAFRGSPARRIRNHAVVPFELKKTEFNVPDAPLLTSQ